MLMPLIPELPENLAAVTFDLEADSAVNCDVVDFGAGSNDETLLLESQAKIAGESKKLLVIRIRRWIIFWSHRGSLPVSELQASVDGLLAEKLQLEQQVENLTREQVQLREQVYPCRCVRV